MTVYSIIRTNDRKHFLSGPFGQHGWAENPQLGQLYTDRAEVIRSKYFLSRNLDKSEFDDLEIVSVEVNFDINTFEYNESDEGYLEKAKRDYLDQREQEAQFRAWSKKPWYKRLFT